MRSIQLDPQHLKHVQDILSGIPVDVYVFGSRATGKARQFSDLDLCLKGEVDKSTLRKLRDHFEQSNLPMKVDLVVWNELTESFQKNIEKDFIPFTSSLHKNI